MASEAGSWELTEGEEIAPGLHALAKLGGGHRYEAYLGFDERLLTTVVVKIVRPGRVEDDAALAGLRAEAAALAALQHPALLRGFGLVDEGPRPRLVLEHIEGPRLSTLVRRHGPLPAEQVVPLAMEICAALHFMHGRGWVHLDVKPANIIMAGPPRLIDLSVACSVEEAAALRSSVGTDSYMAPEQCLPGERGTVGPPADVFGIGVTLHRALSGERPFAKGNPEASDPVERWPQLAGTAAPLEGRIQTGLGSEAATAIEACLHPDPAERPPPAALHGALERVLAKLSRPKLGKLKPRWR